MPQIFISYSRKDIDFVRRLAGDLERAGYDVWWDLTDLRGGDDWPRVIPSAIEASQYVIVVLSPNSAISEWVEKEYTQALALRKKIIPIMLRLSHVPFALNTINYINFTSDDYAANFGYLLSALGYTGEVRVQAVSTRLLLLRRFAIPILLGILLLLALLPTLLTPLSPPRPTPSMIPPTTAVAIFTPTATPTVRPTVTLTPIETLTPTLTPTLTAPSTPRPNWIIKIYDENRNNIAFWILTTSLGIILTYVIGAGALLVSAWRFGSNVFSRSWLTKLASRSLLVLPGLGRWALFLGYRYRLLNQQDVKRASQGYFGLPAVDSKGTRILDYSGDALHEEIAKSLGVRKPVLVLAKAGGGKTTLLSRLHILALTNKLPDQLKGFIPIFVTPAYYNGSLTEAIESVLRRDDVAVNKNIIRTQLTSGKFLILFDGVSEIEGDQIRGLQEILRTAHSDDYRNWRFVITARPVLNIPPETAVFHLQPLTYEVLLGLLPRYNLDKEQEYIVLNQLKLFASKPIEPLLFSMILEQGKSAQVSSTRSLLYEKYFRRLLRVELDAVWEGWMFVLGEFANWITLKSGRRGVGLTHEQLVDKISSETIYARGDSLIKRSKSDYGLPVETELDLLEVLRSSGIMQYSRRWRFAHDTFEEYFAACYIVSFINHHKKLPDLSPWRIGDAQVKSFVGVIEFMNEIADQETLKILRNSNLPALWNQVLAQTEPKEASESIPPRPPLFLETLNFFENAGFDCEPLESGSQLSLLCKPNISHWESEMWKKRLGPTIFIQVFLNRSLKRDDILDLYESAQSVAGNPVVIVAVVNQALSISGWDEINALRFGNGIHIVPIDDIIIQHGRETNSEQEELEIQLNRSMGRQDYYDVRDAIVDRRNFFGRHELASELMGILNQNHHLALLGLRKMGKSSFLQYLRDQVPYPVSYIDLQNGCLDADGKLSNTLYSRILDGWQSSIKVKLQDFEWVHLELSGEPSAAFVEATQHLLSHLIQENKTPRLGIFLDEFDLSLPKKSSVVSEHHANKEIEFDLDSLKRYLLFARTIRGLIEETKQITLVVAGVDPRFYRTNLWDNNTQNPFYRFFRVEYLGPLTLESCMEMIRNIGKQMNLLYAEDALSFIADASGGHPYLARQLCSLAYKNRDANPIGEVTLHEMKKAADLFVSHPDYNDSLEGIWQEATRPLVWSESLQRENKEILLYLAKYRSRSMAEMLANSKNANECEYSIEELRLRHIIAGTNDELIIRFDLFRRWIEKYQKG